MASQRLGSEVLLASDEFFAPKENLLRAEAPVFIPDKYTDQGKWMDGWETRRRRPAGPGPDWCIIRLGCAGVIRAVLLDTANFKGNFPESASVEGLHGEFHADPSELASRGAWHTIVARSPLKGDSLNEFRAESGKAAPVTHVRLGIFPDGGVARLRLLGEVVPDWERLTSAGLIDLAAVRNGGRVTACSDSFFGPRHNLIMPGPSTHMGDGWETRRRRGPGHDWCIIQLGARGSVERVEVDTSYFKGNAPECCWLEGAVCVGADRVETAAWRPLLDRQPLRPHHHHFFDVADRGDSTHVRLSIFPDGGVARLRLWGRPRPRAA